MAVMIGHAGGNEWGGTHGGQPGDQTLTEVYTRDWYDFQYGIVFRPKDLTIADKIAVAMEQACANDNIGYNQSNRISLYNAAKEKNWDLSKITKKVDTDCSALVCVCCNAAGLKVPNDNWTGIQKKYLLATGAFDTFTTTDYLKRSDKLRRGDILLREGYHTVVVLTNGDNVEPAHDYEGEGIGTAVSYGSMNVRTSVSGSIIGVISPGTAVEVLEVTPENWYKIVWKAASAGYAYVSNRGNQYFKYVENKPLTNFEGSMEITAAAMNVRTEPEFGKPVLGTVSKGQKFDIYEVTPNNWYKIKFNDKFGYVSNEGNYYCKFTVNKDYKAPAAISDARARQAMNVRIYPRVENSAVISTISSGTIVKVIERLDNGWLKILWHNNTAGVYAYVSNAGGLYFDLFNNVD